MVSNRLQSDLVVLQKYTLEDLHQLFEAIRISIDRVYPWLPWCHPNYTIAETEEWLKTRPQRWDEEKEFCFSIRDRESYLKGNRQGRIVGGCGIGIRLLPWSGNLGYWLKTGATGQGFATEATKLIAQFGIQEFQLKRIEIVASVENFPSQKVAERSGAFKEGVSRNRLFIHDKFHDAIVYSFIPQDFNK